MFNFDSNFPKLISLFSAPNYCGIYQNKAAYIKMEGNKINVKQFNETPHPYYLPKFDNLFEWSIPFVSDKII